MQSAPDANLELGADGHASAPALAAIADGELSWVARPVAAHITTCVACTERLGDMALQSARVEALLLHESQVPHPWAGGRPVPAGRARADRAWVRRAVFFGVPVLAAAGLAMLLMSGSRSSGELRATARTEQAIGGSIAAVLEPGAHLRWSGSDVVQDTGSIFYRVERGVRFQVRTPSGAVTVHGTCFSVHVDDGRARVHVFEGAVSITNTAGSLDLRAGETGDIPFAPGMPRPARPGDLVRGHQAENARLRAQIAVMARQAAESADAGAPASEAPRPRPVTRPKTTAPGAAPDADGAPSQGTLSGGTGTWRHKGTNPEGFEARPDDLVRHNGKPAGLLRSKAPGTVGFGNYIATVSALPYLGRRIRLSASLKAEDVKGWAGLWMRIDGTGDGGSRAVLGFDNMHDRAIRGTSDWTRYDIVLDVPPGSLSLWFGTLLEGDGAIWLGDLAIDVVDTSVPITGKR